MASNVPAKPPPMIATAAHAEHLLNVRAGNMSALRDDPDHFVRWLVARGGRHGEPD
jgi:uncharacterized NAD(P)/FAD-binding protein YdhS